MVITSIAEQGGVGKTAVCFNLSWYLASKGEKVLMLDLDAQAGNLSYFAGARDDTSPTLHDVMLGTTKITDAMVKLDDNLYIVPANENILGIDEVMKKQGLSSLKEAIEPIRKKFDYIFIDVNPTPSIIHAVTLIASDAFIIPTKPDAKAISGTSSTIDTYREVKSKYNKKLKPLGVVINNYENRTNLALAITTTLEQNCKAWNIPVCNTKIGTNVAISETGLRKIGITKYKPKSNGAKAYEALAKELFGVE